MHKFVIIYNGHRCGVSCVKHCALDLNYLHFKFTGAIVLRKGLHLCSLSFYYITEPNILMSHLAYTFLLSAFTGLTCVNRCT